MSFDEFENRARLYVIGALEPCETDEFEEARKKFRQKAEDVLAKCYALYDAFALSLQPANTSAALKERLVTIMRERRHNARNQASRGRRPRNSGGADMEALKRASNIACGKVIGARTIAVGYQVLAFEGEIDLHVLPRISSAFGALIQEKPKKLVVDLSKVTYIDSSGLAALIEGMKNVEAYGGIFALVGLQENVRSIFETARLDQVLRIFPDTQTAFDAV
jgi:anti-sigma B factor antagonist